MMRSIKQVVVVVVMMMMMMMMMMMLMMMMMMMTIIAPAAAIERVRPLGVFLSRASGGSSGGVLGNLDVSEMVEISGGDAWWW